MRTTLSKLALSAMLLSFPWPAIAAVSVQAGDGIAGLGAAVRMTGLPSDTEIDVGVSTPEGNIQLTAESDAKGEAIVTLKPSQTEMAGIYTVTAREGTQQLGKTSFEVMPDTMDSDASDIRALQKTIEADARDQAVIVVTLRDRFGNPLQGRPVTLISSRTSDDIESDTSETDARGQQRFYVSASKEGTITLRALDLLSGAPLASSATVIAGDAYGMGGYEEEQASVPARKTTSRLAAQLTAFDVIDRFEITAPAVMTAGEEAPKVSVRAVDKNGNTVQDYTGTVRFDAPGDPNAVLPALGRYTFKDSDLGEKSFPITLKFSAVGQQTLRVEDEQDPTLYGEAVVTVRGGDGHSAAGEGIEITSHKDNDTVNSFEITLKGTGPKLVNLIVTGGTEDVEGETDANGLFSIPVTLDSTKTQFTLRVREESDNYASAPLNLKLDSSGPQIQVTIAPDKPVTGEQVLVTVESEPKLAKVSVKLPEGLETLLVEMSTVPGRYQGFLTAPTEPGSYQPIVTATDASGNSTEVRTTLNVTKAGLAKVEGLQAEAKINSVLLQWQGIEGGADGYRIYVGESPADFLYTLDTGRDVSRATVAGLSAGKVYYFAATAIKDGEESTDKSDIIQSRVLGLALEVKAQDSSLVLTWPEVSSQLPLSAYLVEYGVEENTLTERRLINGELKTYTVRDLLNGVHYFVRLTPVTITGDQLTDLAASGDGTPDGSAFTAGPGDPIPFDPKNPPITKKPVVLNQTGVPPFLWWLIGSFALACAGAAWLRHRNLRHSAAFLKSVQLKYQR
jgi:hypothetical protein